MSGQNNPQLTNPIPGYHVERQIGRGGMANVYLARQESLHRHVALKVMNPALVADEGFQKRFLNEGRIIAQLNHPNIVTVFDIGVHDLSYYLSMAYLPGGTLKARIRQGLSLERVLDICMRLGDALGYAHQRGFIHRDIKPGNVLFNEDSSPVLTDFGIAKALGVATQVTATGMTFGSAGYMSPEQAMGKQVDNRSDLYSFGVLMWEMLTGKTPYQAEDSFALALKHATDPIPELPQDVAIFQPIIARLMAKKPEDRFADTGELLNALAQLPIDRPTGPQFVTAAVPAIKSDETVVQLKTGRASALDASEVGKNQQKSAKQNDKKGATGKLIVASLAAAVALGAGLYVAMPGLLNSDDSIKQQTVAKRQAQAEALARQQEEQRRAEAQAQAEALARQQEEQRRAEAQAQAQALARQQEAQQLQSEITALLAEGQRQWDEGKYTEPENDNAFATFRQVLSLDPENSQAKTMLVNIGRIRLGIQYFHEAESLFDQGKLAESLGKAEAGLHVMPDHEGLLALRDRIRTQQARQSDKAQQAITIAALLAKAAMQWQNDKIVNPIGDNAFESYRQILEIDPQHEQARQKLIEIGRIQIGMQHQAEAEKMLARGELKKSLAKIDIGLRLAPDFAGLQQLRKQVLAELGETQ